MYGQDKNPITLYLSVLIGFAVVISMVAIGYDLDNTIAKAVYNPASEWANFVSRKGSVSGIIISVAAIFFLLLTPVRLKHPVLRRTAIVWLSALIIGAGIIVHVFAKEGVDRLRPRQDLLVEKTIDEAKAGEDVQISKEEARLKGKSFSSGHAAMAIMLAAPFFTLRRRYAKTAYFFLILGLANWGAISFSRMVLGSHFLTDVIWSLTFVLGTAAITAHLVREENDLKARYFAPFLLAGAVIGILMNDFEHKISIQSETSDVIAHVPCRDFEFVQGDSFNMDVTIKAAGAPIRMLSLKEADATITLSRHKGIYRNLKCKAVVSLPAGRSMWIPTDKYVTNPHLFPVRVRGTHAIYYGK